jgi:hypothetical protein
MAEYRYYFQEGPNPAFCDFYGPTPLNEDQGHDHGSEQYGNFPALAKYF